MKNFVRDLNPALAIMRDGSDTSRSPYQVEESEFNLLQDLFQSNPITFWAEYCYNMDAIELTSIRLLIRTPKNSSHDFNLFFTVYHRRRGLTSWHSLTGMQHPEASHHQQRKGKHQRPRWRRKQRRNKTGPLLNPAVNMLLRPTCFWRFRLAQDWVETERRVRPSGASSYWLIARVDRSEWKVLRA